MGGGGDEKKERKSCHYDDGTAVDVPGGRVARGRATCHAR